MNKVTFYDLKTKKKFETNTYKLISKKTKNGMRYFAVSNSPSGGKSYKIISKEFYDRNK